MGCGKHNRKLIGQFEGEPPGQALRATHGHPGLHIWVTSTQQGGTWLVVGTGWTEEAFWKSIEALAGGPAAGAAYRGLPNRPVPPATMWRVDLITEADLAAGGHLAPGQPPLERQSPG